MGGKECFLGIGAAIAAARGSTRRAAFAMQLTRVVAAAASPTSTIVVECHPYWLFIIRHDEDVLLGTGRSLENLTTINLHFVILVEHENVRVHRRWTTCTIPGTMRGPAHSSRSIPVCELSPRANICLSLTSRQP